MKNIALLSITFIALGLSIPAQSQNADQRWAISLSGNFYEYKGEFGSELYKFKDMLPGVGTGVSRYLSPSLNLDWDLSFGKINSLITQNNNIYSFNTELISNFISLKYKFTNGYIYPESSVLGPYLKTGIGLNIANTDGTTPTKGIFSQERLFALDLHLGYGFDIHVSPRFTIFLESVRHFYSSDEIDGWQSDDPGIGGLDQTFLHRVGARINLGKPRDRDGDGIPDSKDKCPDTPKDIIVELDGCPKDTDGDGVPDYMDDCPLEVGVASAGGCIDSDNDGVPDKDDLCPDIPGTARLQGCNDRDFDEVPDPIDECPDDFGPKASNGCPDSDGDGVNDKLDECPDTPSGIKVDETGCPDRDGDGINDKLDECPDKPGSIENNGCPEITPQTRERVETIARNLTFVSGKSSLTYSSLNLLREVLDIMKDNPAYSIIVEGHTDSQGNERMNQILSEERANAVKVYFIENGIDPNRIKSTGYGESNPIASNATASGRALNRRVELKLGIR